MCVFLKNTYIFGLPIYKRSVTSSAEIGMNWGAIPKPLSVRQIMVMASTPCFYAPLHSESKTYTLEEPQYKSKYTY